MSYSHRTPSCVLPASHVQQQDSIRYKVIRLKKGWGYDIYRNGDLVIHQPNIPAVKRSQPFHKEEDAKRTAQLVVDKMMKGNWPPSIGVQELDSMKVAWKGR